MAAVVSLVRRDDFVSDVDSLSFMGYTDGIQLAESGWVPAVPSENDPSLAEALTLRVRGSSADNLAAKLQGLDEKIRQVARYGDPQEMYGVWLRAQQLGETGARQALVLSARRSAVPMWEAAARDSFLVHTYGLALERTPWWEDDSAVVYGLTGLSTVGGMDDYTTYGGSPGALLGDYAARLAAIDFDGESGGGGPLTKFWMGFRTERFGARANFQPTWSLEKGAAFDTDTTGAHTNADANAKDGYKTITTFATVATMLRRATIRVSDVTTHPTDQRGTYLVLLRAKLSSAGTVNVRLADALYSTTTFAARDRVQITSTSWQFYEMGTVKIPSPGRVISGLDLLSNYALGVDAEQIGGTSGTPALHCDCLVLIPVGEGWCSADIGHATLGVQFSGSDTQPLYLQDRADGTKASVWVSGGKPKILGVPRISGGLPQGSGILVVAAQRNAVSTLADTLTVNMQVYRRWDTLRGAE